MVPWLLGMLCVAQLSPLQQLLYFSSDTSCPSWSRVTDTVAECEEGAAQLRFADASAEVLQLADRNLPRPKAELPRNCILIAGVLYWNPTGSNTARAAPSVSAVCIQVSDPPTPVYVLPPYSAPGAATETTTLPVPGEEPTATVTIVVPSATPQEVRAVPGETPAFKNAGPVIVDVNALAQEATDAACVEYDTLNVLDDARTASTTFYNCQAPCVQGPGVPGTEFHKGRLDDDGWVAGRDEAGEWYQMDCGEPRLVSGVVLQGGVAQSRSAWTSRVSLLHSPTALEGSWIDLGDAPSYTASYDKDTKIVIKAQRSVLTRYIRIYVLRWHVWPVLRAGVLLCTGRAISIGGVVITFDQPTNAGIAAVSRPPPSESEGAYETLRLFGIVEGRQQTLGRADGFTGRWTDAQTYEIAFNDVFDGRIDPLVAEFYLKDSAGIQSAAGVPAFFSGPDNAVRFTNDPQPTPLATLPGNEPPPPPGPETANKGNDDVSFIVAAVLIAGGILLCVGVFACCQVMRRAQETEKHKRWMREGKAKANKRMPQGVRSVYKKVGSEPAVEDELEAATHCTVSSNGWPNHGPGPSENPINYTFPAKSTVAGSQRPSVIANSAHNP